MASLIAQCRAITSRAFGGSRKGQKGSEQEVRLTPWKLHESNSMFAGGAGGLISCPGLKSASTRAFDPWSDACDEPSEKYRAYCRKGHGLEKSDDLRALLCERKPQIYRFK
jgi:hypothetical protein